MVDGVRGSYLVVRRCWRSISSIMGRFCLDGLATYFQKVGLNAIASAETVGVGHQLVGRGAGR